MLLACRNGRNYRNALVAPLAVGPGCKPFPCANPAVVLEFLAAPETEHKLLNAAFPGSATVGAPGTAAVGAFALADITGDGWDNLYFQGALSTSTVDALFAELQAGAIYDEIIAGMLDLPQHFAS